MSPEAEDPFHKLFFSRIPAEVAQSFSPEQLEAVKLAFGARSPGGHALDLRFSVPLGNRAWYVVLLAGQMRRLSTHKTLKRLFRFSRSTVNAAVAIAIVIVTTLALLSALYACAQAGAGYRRVPGLDVLPDPVLEHSLR
ncbi:MAG: hypothetical protein U1E38_07860 [Rhodospirillales bacterium]